MARKLKLSYFTVNLWLREGVTKWLASNNTDVNYRRKNFAKPSAMRSIKHLSLLRLHCFLRGRRKAVAALNNTLRLLSRQPIIAANGPHHSGGGGCHWTAPFRGHHTGLCHWTAAAVVTSSNVIRRRSALCEGLFSSAVYRAPCTASGVVGWGTSARNSSAIISVL